MLPPPPLYVQVAVKMAREDLREWTAAEHDLEVEAQVLHRLDHP
jgi:hypothetical protein